MFDTVLTDCCSVDMHFDNTSATEDIKQRSQHHAVTMTTKAHFKDICCLVQSTFCLHSIPFQRFHKIISLHFGYSTQDR